MSVRREKRRDRNGAESWYWIVDFMFRYPDGKKTERIRRYSPVNTRRGAEKYERDIRETMLGLQVDDQEAGSAQPKAAQTLGQFVPKFLATCKVNRNKPSELASKQQILNNHLIPAFGSVRLDAITTAVVEDYKEGKAEEEYKPKTINNHLAVLGRLLRVAKKRGLIDVLPEVSPIRLSPTDADFLTFQEAETLVAATDGQLHAMVQLLLHTGLRIGELRGLRWSDVDLERATMRVRINDWYGIEDSPKSGKKRDIPLNEVAHATLKAHRHRRSPYVFLDAQGQKLRHNSYVKPLWSACKRAGLRQVTWHVLRHSFASHLVMRGVPLKAVAELMGHSTTYVTERYSHLSPDVPRTAVEALVRHTDGTTEAGVGNVA